MKQTAFSGWLLVAALTAAVAVSGCQQVNPTTAGYAVRAEVYADDTMSSCLKIDDATLAHAVRVASLHTGYTDRGIMRVQASLLNTRNRDISCQYKFVWYDANDIEIRPGSTPWRPVILHGGEEVRITGSAAAIGATGFKIEMRPLKDRQTY